MSSRVAHSLPERCHIALEDLQIGTVEIFPKRYERHEAEDLCRKMNDAYEGYFRCTVQDELPNYPQHRVINDQHPSCFSALSHVGIRRIAFGV